ncbi:MAG TPA: histidine phosphatase family protein [Comamonadaceae bacterium]|uniref:histidine phosphatase family protein n=1 Tax=Pulveribacter sp. TaxID=2678893 RepID=UPI000EC70C17|nr:histidine phosphatase family protein [Pulveribacter sp.]HCL87382.1 histidine phosphatase family protein [Comamonadaceae bacterium]
MEQQQATRIIAIRHGETAWNVDTRIQGHLDIALNDTGLRQARRVAAALAGESVAAIYSSDLQRAWATAQAIAQTTGAPLAADAGLRERCFGDFEGRTFAQIEQESPEHARLWRKRDPEFTPAGGGESLTALRERVQETVHRLAARHGGEQVVLVAHGGVMDVLYRLATRLDLQAPRTWQLANAAINRLLWTPGGLSLVGWADTQHLEDGGLDDEAHA